MEIKIIDTEEEKQQVELLRKEVFHLPELSSYYYNQLLSNKIYAIVAIEKGQIIAGVYFHRFNNNLMIDKVFVKEIYQNKGLKIGRGLIMELISLKEKLEELLGEHLDFCYVESENAKSHALYTKIGFRESKLDKDNMFKRI